MYLNTDVGGYLDEAFKDGIPASSVRTRVFEPSVINYRDRVIQLYDPLYLKFLLNEKLRILYKAPHKYHQSRLNQTDENYFTAVLSKHTAWNKSLFEMCMHMPCDLAICKKQASGDYEIDFLHLVFPNGWGADTSIGLNFNSFHKEVERTDGSRVVSANSKFAEHLATSGKVYERVGAYGMRPSNRLDLHPSEYVKPVFENADSLFIRFERQVIMSIPERNAFMFFISTNHVDFRAKPDLIGHAIENSDTEAYSRERIGEYKELFLNYLKPYRATI
jgi:hypothetical protein